MIMATDEQPGSEREGLKRRSFCCYGVGVHHPPRTRMCPPTRKLPKRHATGILMETSSCRYGQLLPSFLTPLPF